MQFSRQSAFGAHIYDVTLRGAWDELSPEEIPAARMALITTARVFEQAYLQHKAGLLDDEIWEGWATQIQLSLGLRDLRKDGPPLGRCSTPTLRLGWTGWRTTESA